MNYERLAHILSFGEDGKMLVFAFFATAGESANTRCFNIPYNRMSDTGISTWMVYTSNGTSKHSSAAAVLSRQGDPMTASTSNCLTKAGHD